MNNAIGLVKKIKKVENARRVDVDAQDKRTFYVIFKFNLHINGIGFIPTNL